MRFFDGGPVWHASVALRYKWPDRRSARKAALKIARKALSGVGNASREHVETGRVAFHLRRMATPAECRLANLDRIGEPDREGR